MKKKIFFALYIVIMGLIVFNVNDKTIFLTELEYIKCGSAIGIPKVLPQISSLIFSILMFGVPLVLITFGVIELAKSIVSGNAEDTVKARGKLAKKFMIAAFAFSVIFIVRTIFSLVANSNDSSDSMSITDCMNCFLSYSDTNCPGSDNGNDVHRGSSYEVYQDEKQETHPEKNSNNSNSVSGKGLEKLFAAAKKADQLTYSGGYTYGLAARWDGSNYPNKLVACDRGVGLTLYFFGYTDVNPTDLTLAGLETYLPKWGWKKITNFSDIQPGDIVFYDRAHNGYMDPSDHVFLVGETVGQRYDWGSTARIQHQGQYSGGMPFTESINQSEFGWAYRMPDELRNQSSTSNNNNSNNYSSNGNT